LLTARNLKQREIAALLAIKQPEASHLLNGHSHKPGEPYQEIGFGL
jgi:predicted XRE-type DNA-binding protein